MSEINEKCETVDPTLLEVEEIKEAVHLAEQAAFTRAELEAYDQYWDAVRRERSFFHGRYEEGIVQGEKMGIEKGEKIGIEKGKLETAHNLIKCGFPIEQVASLTGLPVDYIKINLGLEITENA